VSGTRWWPPLCAAVDWVVALSIETITPRPKLQRFKDENAGSGPWPAADGQDTDTWFASPKRILLTRSELPSAAYCCTGSLYLILKKEH
jgi:hypothetical protein